MIHHLRDAGQDDNVDLIGSGLHQSGQRAVYQSPHERYIYIGAVCVYSGLPNGIQDCSLPVASVAGYPTAPLPIPLRCTSLVLKTFVLKMAQVKAIIWP